MDYDYYSGKDLECPRRPQRPTLSSRATAQEAQEFANEMAVYEQEQAAYEAARDAYRAEIRVRNERFADNLRDAYEINSAQFDLLYAHAWDEGHAEGFRRVAECFDELYDIAERYAQLKG